MSFFPGEKLRYAETHFKFRLPWSLLYRPWPEILADSPFQFVPGEEPTLWIVVRDADRFPVHIESAEIKICGNGTEETVSIPVDKDVQESFAFVPLHYSRPKPGTYRIYFRCSVSRKDKSGKTLKRSINRWNLPGLRPEPLIVKFLAEEPPKAPGYVAGEMHCHTHYSCDHVEFGATPAVLQQAAKDVGLDFVCCTDHAYDFAFTSEDYTKEAESPVPRFKALRDEIASLPKDLPLLLAGEEVSAGNSKGENVHMTVLAPESYMPGLGDCGRYWLENRPTLRIPAHLESTTAHCFAAHPFQPMGIVEKFVFRRGYWCPNDLNLDKKHSIRGIQFWNGTRDEGFFLGRRFWTEELGKGNFLLPIGGNDAHGDLNDTTGISIPLVSLKHSRHHVFGKVRTVVKVDESDNASENCSALSLEKLNKAFAEENCYITDGPALWWERGEVHGVKSIIFHARNTSDYGGAFRHIRIFGRLRTPEGKPARQEVLCIESVVMARAKTDINVAIDNYAYLRAECETADGHFAMTSAAKLY